MKKLVFVVTSIALITLASAASVSKPFDGCFACRTGSGGCYECQFEPYDGGDMTQGNTCQPLSCYVCSIAGPCSPPLELYRGERHLLRLPVSTITELAQANPRLAATLVLAKDFQLREGQNLTFTWVPLDIRAEHIRYYLTPDDPKSAKVLAKLSRKGRQLNLEGAKPITFTLTARKEGLEFTPLSAEAGSQAFIPW
jgi:hypothetical protein